MIHDFQSLDQTSSSLHTQAEKAVTDSIVDRKIKQNFHKIISKLQLNIGRHLTGHNACSNNFNIYGVSIILKYFAMHVATAD